MRKGSSEHGPGEGVAPVVSPTPISPRTPQSPPSLLRQHTGRSTPGSSYYSPQKNRRNGRRSSTNSSVRSSTSNRMLSQIPTLPMAFGYPEANGAHQYPQRPLSTVPRNQFDRGIRSDVSDAPPSIFSRSPTMDTGTSDHGTLDSATESDAAFSARNVPKSPSLREYNIDEATKTVATKLPNEFLQNATELIIQNPAPGSGGWFTSADKSFQYVLVMQHGRPLIWDRRTTERRALDEVFPLPAALRRPAWNGTKGRSEYLDPSYVARTPGFFTIGKVFSILFTEPCSDQTGSQNSPNVSTVLYGEKVYSQITRFVVVQPGKGFCYACPISTYRGQGTLKPACNPSEHAVAYMQGQQPFLLDGEHGITKSPIEVIPSAADSQGLAPTSRIRFGRGQVVQHNIKAKEIGHVVDDHIPFLVSHWREEICPNNNQRERPSYKTSSCPDNESEWVNISQVPEGLVSHDYSARKEDLEKEILHSYNIPLSNTGSHQLSSLGPRRDVIHINGTEYVIISEVAGQLHSGFDTIRKPRAFFKKGRCFMVFWPELAGNPESERTIYWKIRRFVVIRAKATYCLCLSISTYQGQGTTKAGVATQDHVPLVSVDGEVQLHPEEEAFTKQPLLIKTEDTSISIDPMSRINFAKVYTVEYNLKVRNVGRIVSDSIRRMEEYFAEAIKVAA